MPELYHLHRNTNRRTHKEPRPTASPRGRTNDERTMTPKQKHTDDLNRHPDRGNQDRRRTLGEAVEVQRPAAGEPRNGQDLLQTEPPDASGDGRQGYADHRWGGFQQI